jgi:hypothetical protein
MEHAKAHQMPSRLPSRFHLMMNWGDTLEDILNRHRSHLYTVAPAEEPATKLAIPAFVRPERPAEVAQRQRRRNERLQRYEAIRDLHAKGMSVSEIARTLHLNWKTVRKYAQADVFPEKPMGTARRGSILKLYEPYL